MTIRMRLLIAVAVAACVIVLAVAGAGWWAVRLRFDTAERMQADEHLQLVEMRLADHLDGLHRSMADWSDWEGAWEFAAAPAADSPWVRDNITPAMWEGRGIDAMILLGEDGQQLIGWGWKDGAIHPPPPWLGAVAAATPWLVSASGGRGFVSSPDGPRLLVMRPVRHSDGSGPRRGWMVWSSPIGNGLVGRVDTGHGMDLSLSAYDAASPPDAAPAPTADGRLRGHLLLPGPDGRPVAVITLTMDRRLHQAGIEAHRQLVGAALAIAAFCAAVAFLIVEFGVARPLVALDHEISAVASSADPSRRVGVVGASEVAGVARSVNATLASLQAAVERIGEEAGERQALMDAMPDRILVVERDGGFHPAGGPATRSDLLPMGGSLAELFPPAERDRVRMMVLSALRGQRSILMFRDEHRGRERHQEMRLFPIPGGRALVLLRDVTSQIENEQRLQQATAAAEAANRAKTTFLANLSHELRSPLNGILGMTQILAGEDLPGLHKDRLQVIAASADDLLRLINQLLDLSKIESGHVQLADEEFSPVDVAHHVVDALAARAWIKGFDVVLVCDPGIPARVRGDGGCLRQVITNLVANAIKFTAGGEVAVRLGGASAEDGRWILDLSVTDTGPGIAPEVAARLFRPFEQGGAAIASQYGGTGLGLAISKGLVELMGGRIGLESSPGSGSTFRFTAGFRTTGTTAVPPPGVPHRIAVGSLAGALDQAVRTALAGFSGCTVTDLDQADVVVVDAENAAPPSIPAVLLVGPRWRGTLAAGQVILRKPVHPDRLREALLAAAGGPPVPTPAPAPPRPSIADGLRLARVLVVDDQATNCSVAIGLLRMLAMDAHAESDPRLAIDRILAERWDLVLMDCRMPGIDGLEATRRIRSAETARRTTIIALTANASPEDEMRCHQAGMDGYLAKPLRVSELEAVLLRWLGRAAGPSPAADPATARISGRLRSLRAQAGDEAVRLAAEALLDEVPRLLDRCVAAVAAGDRDGLEDAAHALKGDAATCRLDELAAHAAALVDAARSGRCDPSLEPVLAQARVAWAGAQPALRALAG